MYLQYMRCLLQYFTITTRHLHQSLTTTPHRPSRLTKQNASTQTLKYLSNTSVGRSRPFGLLIVFLFLLLFRFLLSLLSILAPPCFRPTLRPPNTVTASLTQNTRSLNDNLISAVRDTNYCIQPATVQYSLHRFQNQI